MKTSVAKAKGRRTQNLVAGIFHLLGIKFFGLNKGDIEPRPMGQSGVDIIFSPTAKTIFPFDIECKTVEKLNIVAAYNKHCKQYENSDRFKLLIHSKNNSKTLVTLSLEDFLEVFFYFHPIHSISVSSATDIHKSFLEADKYKNSWKAIQEMGDDGQRLYISNDTTKVTTS